MDEARLGAVVNHSRSSPGRECRGVSVANHNVHLGHDSRVPYINVVAPQPDEHPPGLWMSFTVSAARLARPVRYLEYRVADSWAALVVIALQIVAATAACWVGQGVR